MIESLNFYDKITPKTVEDLAVHPKKIEDVQKWLILNVLNQEMVLIVCYYLLIILVSFQLKNIILEKSIFIIIRTIWFCKSNNSKCTV